MAHVATGRTNRLSEEPSPYLQQHATNPVDWWPWSDAAFAEAKRRDVPVFLSIGYATCHWCHVMAHESFEDPDVAAVLNGAFVNIKVDREERPDLDDAYMAVCQMMTGGGGWPLTIVMTPDRKPFFAGTYFPKASRFGRPGLFDLVPRITDAWTNRRAQLEDQAEHILAHVRGDPHEHPSHAGHGHGDAAAESQDDHEKEEGADEGPRLDLGTILAGVDAFAKRFDATRGGFGQQPKFPSPHNLLFLLRAATRPETKPATTTGQAHGPIQRESIMAMVETTLDAMAAGGIRDHLGGGFHRYSTDSQWLLPHFEKMLYDQAMLAMAYTEAFQATGNMRHQVVAREILDYVLRDLQDPAGGFHSAEDADSEGVEGKFYVWSRAEIEAVLGKPRSDLFCAAYGVLKEGNFHDEATRQLTGENVLHLPRPLAEVAAAKALPLEVLEGRMAEARGVLVGVRAKRVRPLKDDKVLTDWNALAIAAFSKAATAFQEPRYLEAARRATAFLWSTMRIQDGGLRHRYHKSGPSATAKRDERAFLDDYAYLAWGLLELYDAGLEPAHLAAARAVLTGLHQRFAAPSGGYYNAMASADLVARRKEAYDGALPSGNSTAAWCMVRLARLTGEAVWEERAQAVLDAFAAPLAQAPHGHAMGLIALDAGLGPAREVVVSEGAGRGGLLAIARQGYRPRDVLLSASPALTHVAAWTSGHAPIAGKAAAYVCEGQACKRPVQTSAELAASLGLK